MAIDDTLAHPIDLDALLLSKGLEPLAEEHLSTLRTIEALETESFNEAEVRAYVIDPIVKILGYSKGTNFSVDLEHKLKILSKNLYADYKLTLWEENFWLIEAKRPRRNEEAFGYADLAQAVEYSIHPTVNAALVALCDGIKFEIFDREASLEAPISRIQIKNLSRDFDKIRSLLEPMQVWFFQKRRLVRLIDKIFDKEFNMKRVDEFASLVDRRLGRKRMVVVENFRRTNTFAAESEERHRLVATAKIEDLVELYLFGEHSVSITNAVNQRLVSLSEPSSFHVMLRIFPDFPRDVNDNYMAQALTYLAGLAERTATVNWLPAWLAQGKQSGADLDGVVRFLLKQCLTYFADLEPYRLILLVSCSVRRIAKFMAISNDAARGMGAQLHALARHYLPEISWSQMVASPEGQVLGMIDRQARAATLDFVRRHVDENGNFQLNTAKIFLAACWKIEQNLLGSVDNYRDLCRERSLGDLGMTNYVSVTYDYLGHMTLCLLDRFPKWQAYTLEHHRAEVEALAALGSWSAKKLLGISSETTVLPLPDHVIAERFFLGSVETLDVLRKGYQGSDPSSNQWTPLLSS